MTKPLSPCGTRTARARHRRRNEICDVCATAVAPERRRAAYHRDTTNAERSYWDAVLEKQAPEITWEFDRKRRVMVAVEINDPHTDDPHSQTRRQQQIRYYEQRKQAS